MTGAAAAVTIAVATFRRHDDVVRTVRALAGAAADVPAGVTVDVLVVDNDPDAGARDVVAGLDVAVALRYVHEPRPGIAAARNRALDEVTAPLLVFVDDDEHPRPGWLAGLLAVRATSGATAVSGPVESEFETEPDEWVRAGRFFDRLRWPTGTPQRVAATNNLLLDVAAVRALGVRFDDRFGISGGSDTLFTRQLVAQGGTISWCDEAVMIDRTPADRVTHAWVLRRVYRSGNTAVRVDLALAPDARARWVVRGRAVLAGLLRVGGGGARAVLGRVTSSTVHRARGRRAVSRGAGMLAAASGRVYLEYAR